MPRLDINVALGVGVSGALVDVSDHVRLPDAITYSWGRDDAFRGVDPGTFSFALDNFDGRYTPENPNSSLDTTLVEGAAACLQVGTRLTYGRVRSIEPEFPGDDAAWAIVRVTCEDGFGDAGRAEFPDVTRGAAFGVGCGGFWPLDDEPGSSFLRGVTGRERGLYVTGAAAVEYGVDATVPGGPQQITVSAAANTAGAVAPLVEPGVFRPNYFGDGSALSSFGVWVTPRNSTSFLEFFVSLPAGGGLQSSVLFGIQNGVFAVYDSATASYEFSDPFTVDEPYYLSVEASGEFYVNGTLVHSWLNVGSSGGADLSVVIGNVSYGATEVSLSGMNATVSRVRAEAILGTANTTMYELVGQTTGLAYASAPSDLSESQVGTGDFSGSALDLLNLYLHTEQGDAYITTTGTLTNPTAELNIRARTRPNDVDYTFDVENELSGAPDFIRDLTNLVSRVTVEGSNRDTIVDDADLVSRAGRASSFETVMLLEDRDRIAWGQDRLIRGANTKLRIASVVVDAMTTPNDRSADLLALAPGDRVQFTGLPSTVLGFDTWDGWFLGAKETHTVEAHEFSLHFTPVLPDVAIYDTDRYVDEVLTLDSGINAAVTSIDINTSGDFLTITDLPLTVQVNDEQMTVTACTLASPQSATVTRGVNGTTAASHLANAAVTVVPDSIYAF